MERADYPTVDFYLTKSCNKECHYCTSWTKEMRNLEVDMVFLRELLDYFGDHKASINLLGGEPALIKNLKEVVEEIKKKPNLKINVLSNSLIRLKHPWVLEDPEIHYAEHLVLDFHENEIEKLGNYEFFEENDLNNYNLIIKTPGYESYIQNHNLEYINHKNTILKEFNSRAPGRVFTEQSPLLDRKVCAAFPRCPVFDFEIKKIRHCSKMVVKGCAQYDITAENVDKMFNYELFKFETYCDTCTEKLPKRPNEEVLKIVEALSY